MDIFNAIPVFVAVAEHQGFSAAAQHLGVSKSAVSKRITQLEQQLGARLFHRSTRKLSLTEAGEQFYHYARQANRSALQAREAVEELQGEPVGLLKVQIPMSFGQHHITPHLPAFMAQYPAIELDVVMDDQHHNLIEEGFDLAIRAGDLPDSRLIAKRLARLNSCVCVSPAFYQQHQAKLTNPTALTEFNCLTYSYSSNSDRWQFHSKASSDNQESLEIKVSGGYRINNSNALAEAVLQGLGVARLPTFIAGEYIRRGELVELFPQYDMPHKDLWLLFPQREFLPKKSRAFIDFFQQLFSEPLYWENIHSD